MIAVTIVWAPEPHLSAWVPIVEGQERGQLSSGTHTRLFSEASEDVLLGTYVVGIRSYSTRAICFCSSKLFTLRVSVHLLMNWHVKIWNYQNKNLWSKYSFFKMIWHSLWNIFNSLNVIQFSNRFRFVKLAGDLKSKFFILKHINGAQRGRLTCQESS